MLVVPVPGVMGDGQPHGGRRNVVGGQRCRAESHARYRIRVAAALVVSVVGVLRAVVQAGERGGNRAGRYLAGGTVPGRRDALVPPVLVMPGDIQRCAAFADAAGPQPLGGRVHVVGVHLGIVAVRHPQRRAIRPDAVGADGLVSVVAHEVVEFLGLVALAGLQVVGVELAVRAAVILHHPQGRAVRPEVLGIVVVIVQVEFLGLVARAGRQGVGIYLVLIRAVHPLGIPVSHPHGDAVRPDTYWSVVRQVQPGVQVELLGRVARAGRQGVGV